MLSAYNTYFGKVRKGRKPAPSWVHNLCIGNPALPMQQAVGCGLRKHAWRQQGFAYNVKQPYAIWCALKGGHTYRLPNGNGFAQNKRSMLPVYNAKPWRHIGKGGLRRQLAYGFLL